MPILKLDHQGDVEKVRATIAWLAEHDIPAGDAFLPTFVDTDARVIYWPACVYKAGSEAGINPDTGVEQHSGIASGVLERFGLDSAARQPGMLSVLQKTDMLSEPPAQIVAQAVTV